MSSSSCEPGPSSSWTPSTPSTPSSSSHPPPPPPPSSNRPLPPRKYVSGSMRSRSFDGRLDLETLPEAHDEEAEAARLEEEEKNRSEVRLRSDPRDREENNNHVDAKCGERAKDTIRRPTRGTVRSLARHLSEKQRNRNIEERIRLAKHRMSMPEVCSSTAVWQPRIQTLPPCPPPNLPPSSSTSTQLLGSTRDSPPHSIRSAAPLIERTPSQFYAGGGSIRALHPGTLMVVAGPAVRPSQDSNNYPGLAPMHPQTFPYPSDFQQVWYPLQTAPVFLPLGAPMMHSKMHTLPPSPPPNARSMCREVCCGGCAQLLWTVVCIILMGIIAALLLTLFVV